LNSIPRRIREQFIPVDECIDVLAGGNDGGGIRPSDKPDLHSRMQFFHQTGKRQGQDDVADAVRAAYDQSLDHRSASYGEYAGDSGDSPFCISQAMRYL